MSTIEFEEQGAQFKPQTAFNQSQPSGLVGWLVKIGLVKDQSKGKSFLMGVVAFNIIVTVAVIYYFVL